MSAAVDRYIARLEAWEAARAAAGGTLTDDEEEEHMTACHDIWVKMTEAEMEELDQRRPGRGKL